MSPTASIVQKEWSFCDVLRDDGVGYRDYLEQLIYEGLLEKNAEDTKSGAGSTLPQDRVFVRW
jgi:type I restriction enzyme M protein